MRFVLLMAAREVRASWRRLLFFFVCVAIGVGAIVALRSIIQSVRNGLAGEARAIVGGDVAISSNRGWAPEIRSELDSLIASAPVAARVESIETATMVRPVEGQGTAAAKMVELRGVDAAFPLYGSLVLQSGQPYSHDLIANHGALVRPELLAQLGLSVGDRLVIGGQPYTIRGVISEEPGRRAGSFSLGSRVLVDVADLRSSGLLSYGSRANYEILLKMDDAGVAPLARTIRARFRDRFVNVRTFRNTEDAIGDDMLRAENHLSLVGFVILVLGGIGVWSVTRVFVRQKVKSVAILKCLGATTGQVLLAYVAQIVLLGLGGSALGVLLARAGIASIPPSFAAAIGIRSYGVTASAVWQGVSVGLLVSLLFSVVPLLEVRRVKPLLLIRGAVSSPPFADPWWTLRGVRARLARLDWVQVLAAAIMSIALAAIASWQAASVRIGVVVVVGFAVVALVLHLASSAIIFAVRPLTRARSFPLRHAVLSLGRPGNQTRVILLAVGLGSFFVTGVRALQANLLQQFSVQLGESGADMFLIEILPDQVERMRAFLDARKASDAGAPRLIPVLRARVTGVRGGNEQNFRDMRGRGREYVITYRDRLEPNETVMDGTFWPPGSLPENTPLAEVSIEENIHDNFRVNVGDVMRFDVLGRVIDARVTSIRKVEWQDARNGGFMFVFRPGPFAHAPQTFIGILRAPQDAGERGRFQRDLVAAFPNVTAIDVREILATISRAVDTITLAITLVGAIALASGVLILVGAVAMTKFQRVYEAAILRTLGASTRVLGAMLAVEYGALGLLAGLVGGAGALALSWGVCRHVLDIPWRPHVEVAAAGAVLTMLLVGVVGVAASYDVLRKKPLGTLRAE